MYWPTHNISSIGQCSIVQAIFLPEQIRSAALSIVPLYFVQWSYGLQVSLGILQSRSKYDRYLYPDDLVLVQIAWER